jgi:hypothetical protein
VTTLHYFAIISDYFAQFFLGKMIEERNCRICQTQVDIKKSEACPGCTRVKYCSPDCLKKDWEIEVCIFIKIINQHQYVCGKESFTKEEYFAAYLTKSDEELAELGESDDKARNYLAFKVFYLTHANP